MLLFWPRRGACALGPSHLAALGFSAARVLLASCLQPWMSAVLDGSQTPPLNAASPAPASLLPVSSMAASRAFRCSCPCCREAHCSVLLRRVVVRAKLLVVDIESVTCVLDTVKHCVCLCPSPLGRNLALLSSSLLAESFPCSRRKIRSATVSSNYKASSPCALASAAADSVIKFTSAPCSVCFAVGNFSTFQFRAACPVCARFSSIGFRVCLCLPSSCRTRHPLLDPHLTSSLQTSIEGRRRSCIPKKSQESCEDEASRVIFTKCSTKAQTSRRSPSSSTPSPQAVKTLWPRVTGSTKRNPMGIWSRIETMCLARQTCVINDVNRKPSSCFRLSRRISQDKQICYSC
jgi:hypothetical protein